MLRFCESVLRNRLPETIIRRQCGCRNYELSLFSAARLFAGVYLFHVHTVKNFKYCATSRLARTSCSRVDLSRRVSTIAVEKSGILYGRSSILLFGLEGTPPCIERPCRVSCSRCSMRARIARTWRFRVETFPLFSNILEYLSFRRTKMFLLRWSEC